jgi:phosphate transport system substrate-binding protein
MSKPCSPFNLTFRATQGALRWAGKLAVLALFAGTAQAQVVGTGSSLVRDLMTAWTGQYGASVGGASYEATGSSVGVAKASDGSVDFGVSDVPLTGAALRQAGLRQLPLVAAAVAVVVNLPELAGKPIKLNGDILADIYQGSITQWNHSQIAGLNPSLALPNKAIVPIWRADGSGQSYVLSSYLARANAKWRRNFSSTSNLNLTAGRGVRGGQAMLDAVKSTPGAIGYEPLGAAQSAGLVVAELQNAAGKSIAPSAASISAAMDNAQWSQDNNAADLDGSAGAGAYPMAAVAYALVPAAPKAGRKSALPLMQAAVGQGDAQARQAGFVPLSSKGKTIVAETR